MTSCINGFLSIQGAFSLPEVMSLRTYPPTLDYFFSFQRKQSALSVSALIDRSCSVMTADISRSHLKITPLTRLDKPDVPAPRRKHHFCNGEEEEGDRRAVFQVASAQLSTEQQLHNNKAG